MRLDIHFKLSAFLLKSKQNKITMYSTKILKLAMVILSDIHLTGSQEIAGSFLAVSSNILSWRLIMKHFFWQKNVHNTG